ncbi:MAG: HlyD family efflux transporter periplasmic adaptor subunit [Planctomycetota bacterium]
MATPFSQTTRALSADGFRRPLLGMLVAALLAVVWGAWFFAGEVPIYRSTDRARLELEGRISSVSATVPGRVVAVNARLGQAVEEGAVLVQLDDRDLAEQLAGVEARRLALAGHSAALARQIALKERALARFGESAQARLAEEVARRDSAVVAARVDADEVARLTRLEATGGIAEFALVQARAREDEAQARAEALRLGVVRIEGEQRVETEDRRAGIEGLRVEQQQLEGEVEAAVAAATELGRRIEDRALRAPTAGVVAERVSVAQGSVVAAGQEVVTIAHAGPILVTAEFDAAEALGHIRVGQPSTVSLPGFPWTEYGSLAGRVLRVGTEARGGALQVELELADAAASRIPVQHGLTATVRVEVERGPPAEMVLRALGKLVASAPPSDGPASDA